MGIIGWHIKQFQWSPQNGSAIPKPDLKETQGPARLALRRMWHGPMDCDCTMFIHFWVPKNGIYPIVSKK
jgi:hypothetical protein